MKVLNTKLAGVVIIEPDVHRDERGFFLEAYQAKKYSEFGVNLPFVQDNHSKSIHKTLRGLHGQKTKPQGKLVRVLAGEIYDVAADIRPGSPTFGQWIGVVLSSANYKQIYVPPGYVHGFCVLSEAAEVEYKCTQFYDPADEMGIRWNDPTLDIGWPIKDPLLSNKDKVLPTLKELQP